MANEKQCPLAIRHSPFAMGLKAMKRYSFLILAILLLRASPALAQEATPVITDDQVNTIAKKLYCPVCENISLDVCPTQACADWREEIRLKLSQGQTEQQIIQYFVDRYGDRVLGTPPARGLNWLVYILPPVMILAGIFVLFRAFRVWKQATPKPAAETPPYQPPDDKYVKRLEDQLKKR